MTILCCGQKPEICLRLARTRPHGFMFCRDNHSIRIVISYDFIEFCRCIVVARVETHSTFMDSWIVLCPFLIAPGCWSPVSTAVLEVAFHTCSCDVFRKPSGLSGLYHCFLITVSYPLLLASVGNISHVGNPNTHFSWSISNVFRTTPFPWVRKLTAGPLSQGPFESRRCNPERGTAVCQVCGGFDPFRFQRCGLQPDKGGLCGFHNKPSGFSQNMWIWPASTRILSR